MNLEDLLGKGCPNGLHDAEIEQLTVDYIARTAVFVCSIWVGDLNATDAESREAYRRGRLVFKDLQYCVVGPPDSDYPYAEAGGVAITSDGPLGSNGITDEALPSNLPDDAFAHYFFVTDWNAYIYVAAKDAEFGWCD